MFMQMEQDTELVSDQTLETNAECRARRRDQARQHRERETPEQRELRLTRRALEAENAEQEQMNRGRQLRHTEQDSGLE